MGGRVGEAEDRLWEIWEMPCDVRWKEPFLLGSHYDLSFRTA